MKNNGKGNRKAQRQRRRARRKLHIPKQDDLYELIDGNLSYYPVAYCKMHGAWLTVGLMETHRCLERECRGCITELEQLNSDEQKLNSKKT